MVVPAGRAGVRLPTILAEADGRLVGFVHVVLDADERWGSLVDNLHVAHAWQRHGTRLRTAGEGTAGVAGGGRSYLWVLEQNVRAQAFYQAQGGSCVERAAVKPPGGIDGRLCGQPFGLRYFWPVQGANSEPSVPRT